MGSEDGDAVTERVLAVLPEWGHAISQLNALIAEQMGVTLSDLDCLDALVRHGPATGAVLAEHVNLTSGSVSRMIDRLEVAGCVNRVRDTGDRRRVLVEPTTGGLDRVRAYWAGLAAGTRDDLAEFTEAEIAVLLRFVQRARDTTTAEVTRLRTPSRGRRS